MLIGAKSLACSGEGTASYPGRDAAFDQQDGCIPYGSLIIDQRTLSHKNCLDYMIDWCSWLDVQNGADFKGADRFEEDRRFITTPRDLATYVHFDALYEAYLNAGLVLLGMGLPNSKGFPEPSPSGKRDAFATFDGPHILSLVTEVATRCLKAVRRQKFNYHRRARPEAIGGRMTLASLGKKDGVFLDKLGCSAPAFDRTLEEIPEALLVGERVAVGILMEQAPSYGDGMQLTFKSFDGDYVALAGEGGSCPNLSIIDANGRPVSARDWWLRHVLGEEVIRDL